VLPVKAKQMKKKEKLKTRRVCIHSPDWSFEKTRTGLMPEDRGNLGGVPVLWHFS